MVQAAQGYAAELVAMTTKHQENMDDALERLRRQQEAVTANTAQEVAQAQAADLRAEMAKMKNVLAELASSEAQLQTSKQDLVQAANDHARDP